MNGAGFQKGLTCESCHSQCDCGEGGGGVTGVRMVGVGGERGEQRSCEIAMVVC